MQSHKISTHKGFTLIEILIVSALVTTLAGFALIIGIDSYNGYLLHAEEQTIVSVLSKARSRALNNMFETSHGVHIEPNAYVLFRGTPYNPAAATNEQVPRNSSIAMSGLSEVIFAQLSGDSNTANSLTLSNGIRTETITLNYEGRINW